MNPTPETKTKDDLGGVISLEFIPGISLNDFCAKHIENYDPQRYDVLALRFHYGQEMSLIAYAIDNEYSSKDDDPLKGPVKKFKIDNFSISDILSYITECNFTITTGLHPLKDLDLINQSKDDTLDIRETETEKTEMKTMVSCTNMLNKMGFTTQFKAFKAGLKSLDTERVYAPNQVNIVNFYRFEGESDPAENSILYAIETSDGEKGTLTDAYGMYNDAHVTNFIKQVEEIQKKINRDETL
ncbi:MAG: hypothetical protein K0R65_103 [Crocinitomicaceae bacterium]|jgi:hypothetical protein|nr:hypothetical protein [Crocinitomicaceae bacterium]